MSTVPYIFATQYGNIPLSELDANFANVKANVDYATAAGSATTSVTAGTVTTNAQPNITSVGTLSSLSVTANITSGNITGTAATFTGNITGGNLLGTTAAITGNITAGNITGTAATFTGNITGGNLLGTTAAITGALSASTIITNELTGDIKGSVYADDSTVMVDAIDNNIVSTTSSFTTTSAVNSSVSGIITLDALEIVTPNWVILNSNTATALSNTTSYNMLVGNVPGLTITVDMPENPVEGQVTRFAVTGNSLNLVLGNGNVNYDFSGVNDNGNTYGYIYRTFTGRWVRSQ